MNLEQVLQVLEQYYRNPNITHTDILLGLRKIAEVASDYADITETEGEA